MRIKLRRLLSLLAFFIIIWYVMYTELLIFFFKKYHWLTPKCEKHCLKLLLVADPHIKQDDKGLFEFLCPMSSRYTDKYLKYTFGYAYNFVRPDYVIFLGDLFDEGSAASEREFYYYYERFEEIFLQPPEGNPEYIFLPGERDIGGALWNKLSDRKIERFESFFGHMQFKERENYVFVKLDQLLGTMPNTKEFNNINKTYIGLNHIPIMYMQSNIEIIQKKLPHVILTGHHHEAILLRMDGIFPKNKTVKSIKFNDNRVFEMILRANRIYEIIMPTCSYILNSRSIGYGYVLLENDRLKFTILWSPLEYERVIRYLIVLKLILLLGISVFIFFKVRSIHLKK